MTLLLNDLALSQAKFHELFPLQQGSTVIAGGQRPGQTAGMARYTVVEGKRGKEHVIELGYGTVPERAGEGAYPLLLPKLDSQLGRFNIDGNINNILILKFLEEGHKVSLQRMRNFNAPCEIGTGAGRPTEKLALAMIEIAHMRVKEITENKINVKQEPQVFINLIHHAIEMRAGHVTRARTA